MYYKIVNKQTGESPSRSNQRMSREELMEVVYDFCAFDHKQFTKDEDKLAYYKSKSFYNVVEV